MHFADDLCHDILVHKCHNNPTAANKINGELFLELPEDEEFLKELKLSLGFKKLVVKKAKEVRIMQEKKLAHTRL